MTAKPITSNVVAKPVTSKSLPRRTSLPVKVCESSTISQKTLMVYPPAPLGRIDPFNITATTLASSSVAFSGLDPQPAHPDSPSSLSFGRAVTSQDPSQHSQSGSSETVLTYVSGNSAQPRVGKASLIALQNLDAPRPARHRDSGIRFNENGEQEVGPSRSTNGVPPTYTPD